MRSAPATVAGTLALGWLVAGCNDLSRFSTGDHEAYCGSVVLGSSFREGLSPRMQMRLRLDASQLDGPASPGRITTFEAADGVTEEKRWLDEVELRIIGPLQHDALSQLDFGEGRERTAIYAVSPNEPTEESVSAFVSLKTDDSVEVRLLRPGRPGDGVDAPPDGQQPVFGLFPLARRKGACGF
jgi:hypothetical protein